MKIAIVGSKPDTWQKVSELGPEWEIWRFSRKNFDKPPKPHRWFEIHHPRNYLRYEHVKPGYTQFLKDVNAVTHRTFPFDRLLDEFGPYFFSGGQAPWIMAYAIFLGADTIGLWGIDPMGDYKPQRSEIQHFIQVAHDRGIDVIAPEDSIMNYRPLYAIDVDFGCHAELSKLIDPIRLQRVIEGQNPLLDNDISRGDSLP